MKKNIKYLIIALLIGVILLPNNVLAKNNATASASSQTIPYEVQFKGRVFRDSVINISFNGNKYEGLCVTPYSSLPTGYQCSDYEYGTLSAIVNSGQSHVVKRMAAVMAGFGSTKASFVCTDNDSSKRKKCWDDVDAASTLAANAKKNGGLKKDLTEPTIEIKRESSTDFDANTYQAVHTIYTIPDTLENVEFECQNCEIVGATSYPTLSSMDKHKIIVKVKKPNCKYKIIVKYKWSTAKTLYCTSNNGQNVWAWLTNERNVDKGQQEFSFSVDANTNYYKNYCANGGGHVCEIVDGVYYGINGTEVSEQQYHEECDNTPKPEPITCTEKTTIEKPEYCDDANDQYITITSPKNVKYCILNSNDDAEQTYQMLDGQVEENNPYCAVYCKEDYKMTMPGAQYANSGRYFELKNTKVEATRTCYTTNPSSDKNKTNIDTATYIQNVKDAQVAVAKAKTELEKAKAEKNAPIVSHSSSACGQSSTWYSKDSTSYTTYTVTNCNSITGICSFSTGSGTTNSYEWGTELTESHPCVKRNLYGACTQTKCSVNSHSHSPAYVDEVEAKTSALNAAVNNLRRIINLYEQCYNWTNDLCLDTIVEFEYDEQYSGDINFERVSQTIDKDKEVGYATGQTIDNAYTATGSGSLRQYNYPYCDTNGCNQVITTKNISFTDTHIKKVSVGNAEYANTQEFQTNYPSGSIETLPSGSDVKHNYSYLGAVFPIALNTSRGVYQWKLNFSKLGQFNDTRTTQCSESSVGRLDNVIEKIGEDATANVEYVCVYVVSCDECDYECVGEGCLIPDKPKCPECDVYCENCIFDGNMTYVYQAKSLNELAVHGSNWATEKGIATKQEIETNGESIYIEDEYTYYMDQIMMKNLRDYNKEKDNYIPDDLTYHELNGVKNAYGTSDFLRNEKNENKYFKTIKRNEVWTLWEKIGDNMGRSWK